MSVQGRGERKHAAHFTLAMRGRKLPIARMRGLLIFLVAFCLTGPARAEMARVAVASNFLTTAQNLAHSYEAGTGHQIELVSGATGALFAQIMQGAPYDLFLSADVQRVARLEAEGRLARDGRKPYAVGRLVLFTTNPDLIVADLEKSLRRDTTRHFAMADPALAPYGRAALEIIKSLGLEDVMDEKAVIGANVGQTFAFIATRNVEMGFVAQSQAQEVEGAWVGVPDGLHAPVVQEAGLLTHASDNAAAKGFFDFLGTPQALGLIRAGGYGAPQE